MDGRCHSVGSCGGDEVGKQGVFVCVCVREILVYPIRRRVKMVSCLCEGWFDEVHGSGMSFRRTSLFESLASDCQWVFHSVLICRQMTRKRSLLDGRNLELTRGDLAASFAALLTFSLPGIPIYSGTHMKTIVTEVVNSVRRRMYGSEMTVSEARESEIRR